MSERASGRGSSWLATAAKVLTVNAVVFGVLLMGVELVFGNWVRPLSLNDLKRFSIPIDVTYSFDPSVLYPTGGVTTALYSRDRWGLRGGAASLAEIDVVTVGGSTTDQRNVDDNQTWQAIAARELRAAGRPLVFTNAGVDGQSTVGHAFSFQYWFPLLEDLRPQVVLFYVGINDVLKGDDRDAYDRSVDASTWRTKSVLFQMYKVVRGNLRARAVGVTHGQSRRPAADFTDRGLLADEERQALATDVTASFLERIRGLRVDAQRWGALPVFVTQTAYGWNADHQPPRGLHDTVRMHGRTANFADVAFLHQHLNRGLMLLCAREGITCFDMAAELAFDAEDYYDPLHNTPVGAEKIGRYLASRLTALDQRLPRPDAGTGAR
jgi:lysophospholipase L1-like esterase